MSDREAIKRALSTLGPWVYEREEGGIWVRRSFGDLAQGSGVDLGAAVYKVRGGGRLYRWCKPGARDQVDMYADSSKEVKAFLDERLRADGWNLLDSWDPIGPDELPPMARDPYWQVIR